MLGELNFLLQHSYTSWQLFRHYGKPPRNAIQDHSTKLGNHYRFNSLNSMKGGGTDLCGLHIAHCQSTLIKFPVLSAFTTKLEGMTMNYPDAYADATTFHIVALSSMR